LDDISKFYTWKELCDRLRLKDFELFEYLKMGLPLYIKCRNQVQCPPKFHRYRFLQERQNSILKPAKIKNYLPDDCNSQNNPLPNYIKEDYAKAKSRALEELPEKLKKEYLEIENEMSEIDKNDPNHISWKYFEMPTSDFEIEDLIEEHKDYFFKVEDVAEYQNIIKKSNAEKQTDDKMATIYEKAGPELEMLYSILRNRFGCWPAENAKEIREFVISEFNKDRDVFNFIKLGYLEDNGLYKFRERQAKADFIGKLFLKIAQNRNLDKKNVQALYTGYLHYKRSYKVEK
jgi:hypothetical protein